MTRTIFLSMAAVALLATACERHSASELGEEHGHPSAEADSHRAPTDVPSNPGGAAPATTNDDGKPPAGGPAPATATPAPATSSHFFPTNK